ncbi:MAG: FMN-binding protein [Rubripirellula sp.]
MKPKLVHAVRVAVVAALLLLIPSPASRSVSDGSVAPDVELLDLSSLTTASPFSLDPAQDANGMWRAVGADDKTVGFVARTLPLAKDIVGYRGPTEAAIVFDPDLKIVAVRLLESADTHEHVDAVIHERAFLDQFIGWPWGGPAAREQIDGVSGATLTSMALAEGVLKRIGGARPSLVFGDALSIGEAQEWIPEAKSLDEQSGELRDVNGQVIGRLVRTGPHSDDIVGYQGPSEMLLRLSTSNQVEAFRLRKSFDNEPYVGYVRDEYGFWPIFQGKTIKQLAEFDLQEARVEGVSGATMTSMAVAETLVAAAGSMQAEATADAADSPLVWYESIRWTPADFATIAMLLSLGLLRRLGLFRNRAWRRTWLIGVVAVIGLWAGNLISMALVAGWSAEGAAWRLAPGLSALAAITFLMPPVTKSNPYCNHLCPHGAVQQWLKPGSASKRRVRIPQRWMKWLVQIPGVSLVAAYLSLLFLPAIDLSSWEPFHAYLFRIAGWGAFALAIASLLLSAAIPMGYCRLGCPTGRLIDYLRRTARSEQIVRSDFAAICLLIVALAVNLR